MKGHCMNGSIALGIDVAKAKLDCALRLLDGKFKNKVVENNPKGFKTLTEWLEKHGATTAHVCMEATGVYWGAGGGDAKKKWVGGGGVGLVLVGGRAPRGDTPPGGGARCGEAWHRQPYRMA